MGAPARRGAAPLLAAGRCVARPGHVTCVGGGARGAEF
jgi:hypothetical protein